MCDARMMLPLCCPMHSCNSKVRRRLYSDLTCQVSCLTGLVEAKVASATATARPANFDEWIMRVMGAGIADLFMRPYNFKVGRYNVRASSSSSSLQATPHMPIITPSGMMRP